MWDRSERWIDMLQLFIDGLDVEAALASGLWLIFVVPILLLGGFLTYLGASYLWSLWQTSIRQAETVTGTVQSSRVVQNMKRHAGDRDADTAYEPHVEYEFRYHDGETYTTKNIYPGSEEVPVYTRGDTARNVADEYEPGQEVEVYVPRDDPENAYLERPGLLGLLSIGSRYVGALVIGLVFVAFGLWLARVALGGVLEAMATIAPVLV